jgi:hypothetical protein
MISLRQALFCIFALALAGSVDAGTIYKCRQAGGVVSYQDKPCPGRQISVLRSASSPAPAKAAAPTASAADPGADAGARARPVPTGRAPRPSFKCVRPDGSYYYTGDAHPKRMLVDAAGSTIALISGAPAAPPGKVWAQEQCGTATRAESCQYYQEQIAANDARQSGANSDLLRRLKREGQRLRAIHNHRCS